MALGFGPLDCHLVKIEKDHIIIDNFLNQLES